MSGLTTQDLEIILHFGLHIARIDGEIDPFEKKILGQFSDALKLTPEDRNKLLAQPFSLADGLKQLGSAHSRALLIKTLCAVAHSDGETHPKEVDFISKVIEKMGQQIFILPQSEWGSYEGEVATDLKAFQD